MKIIKMLLNSFGLVIDLFNILTGGYYIATDSLESLGKLRVRKQTLFEMKQTFLMSYKQLVVSKVSNTPSKTNLP